MGQGYCNLQRQKIDWQAPKEIDGSVSHIHISVMAFPVHAIIPNTKYLPIRGVPTILTNLIKMNRLEPVYMLKKFESVADGHFLQKKRPKKIHPFLYHFSFILLTKWLSLLV